MDIEHLVLQIVSDLVFLIIFYKFLRVIAQIIEDIINKIK